MRVLSGIQPSGDGELHIGNYLGALKQWIALQEQHEAYYMLANLHAITVPFEPKQLHENVYKVAAAYIALGLDPNRCTIFVQSLVPEHSELAWLLNAITPLGELRRMTQFKEKVSLRLMDRRSTGQGEENVSVGLFNYPVLQAADILLYQPQLVPIGEDQKQHVELTRNLAQRFNKMFGPVFTIPDPFIPTATARIMGLDNPAKKMSKSLGVHNYISLLDSGPKIREKLQAAVTDSDPPAGGGVRFDPVAKPAISNLLTIFSAVTDRSIKELTNQYRTAGYGQFKEALADALESFLTPVQQRYQELITDREALDRLLRAGSTKAQSVAKETLSQVKEKMGVL